MSKISGQKPGHSDLTSDVRLQGDVNEGRLPNKATAAKLPGPVAELIDVKHDSQRAQSSQLSSSFRTQVRDGGFAPTRGHGLALSALKVVFITLKVARLI